MRLHLFTPDAQYPDDGEIERQTAGPDVDWTICRERKVERLPVDALAQTDGVVLWHEMRIDADFIAKMPKCRVIVRAGVGFDHIDLEVAGRLGIPVCNTPDYGTSEVADHAIALMLALTRGVVCFHEHLVRDPVGGSTAPWRPSCAVCAGGPSAWSALVGLAPPLRFAPRPSVSELWVSIPMFRPEPAYRDLKAAGIADRLILTPHAAWASPESRADARRLAVETAILYLAKGHLRNLVNGPFLAAARR